MPREKQPKEQREPGVLVDKTRSKLPFRKVEVSKGVFREVIDLGNGKYKVITSDNEGEQLGSEVITGKPAQVLYIE